MIALLFFALSVLQLPVEPEPIICRVVPADAEPPISCIRTAPDAWLCAHRGDPGVESRWCVFMPVIGGENE